jgi:hypothetical protein
MTRARCQRAWEAGAIEDGRLDAQSVASFTRHAESCATCTREAFELVQLLALARAVEPSPLSVLEQRRQRQSLLRAANALTDQPIRPSRVWRVAALSLLFVCAVLTLVVERHRRVTLAGAEAELRAPRFELSPVVPATWTQEIVGSTCRVVLTAGALSIHVQHLRPEQHFFVALPDGELEVRGTRFIVEANGGRTTRARVTEGVVAVRLRGRPEKVLVAGEDWTPPPLENSASADLGRAAREPVATPTENAKPTADDSRIPPKGRLGSSSANTPRTKDSTALVAENPVSGVKPDITSQTTPSSSFAVGMSAFASGNYLEADDRLGEFVARFEQDSRCEDAVYLRTVIAVRRGDSVAALARGRDYLRRFPNGLRRPEIQRLLDGARAVTGRTDAGR